MGKIISFSIKEILPALLDKSKTQTIRPAWVDIPKSEIELRRDKKTISKQTTDILYDRTKRNLIKEKPPRYKVGDKVQLVWNKESKKHWKVYILEHKPYLMDFINHIVDCKECLSRQIILGKAEIIEVFEVEFYYKPCKWGKACVINLKDSLFSDRAKISKLDGFKDTTEMFRCFHKQYDLSTPKKFYVYRWKWLK